MNISPFKTGLDTDMEPWIAPADSFSVLDNIHIKHGYLQKREGFTKFADLEPMAAGIAISDITNASNGVVTTGIHGYTTGDKVYIDSVLGMTEVNNKIFTITVLSPTTFALGIDTTSLTPYAGAGTSALIDDTTDRVMGITRYIEAAGGKTTIAFNTKRAYRLNTAATPAIFVQLDLADILSGDEYDFIWSANWQSGGGTNRLYFTNGKAGTPGGAATVDGIRYYDSTVSTTATTAFNPVLSPAAPAVQRILDGGKLIFSLGQRLIVLGTYEYNASTGATTYNPQRARWCAKQNPGNWNDVVAGGGGFTDAATGDQIISARQLQNQIIVFFSNSVWSLTPTSDPNRAFKWQRINNFRAAEGKMASVGYDRYATSLGIRGITATDGVETRRIDERISDFCIDEINVNEFEKVFCERSYNEKRWWTLYNKKDTSSTENESALIYDDDSGAFSTYKIDMNCLGYGNLSIDYTLDDFTLANNLDKSLDEFSDETLLSYFFLDNQEIFLGGDIFGSIYQLESGTSDDGSSIDSEFITAGWNPYKDQNKEARFQYVDIYFDTDVRTKGSVSFYKDTDQSPYITRQIDFLPNLHFITKIIGATNTNPVSLEAPNHGLSTGDEIYIYGVEGMEEINSGESSTSYTVTVVDSNNFTLDGIDGTSFNVFSNGGGVYKKLFFKTKTWKRVYAGGVGFQHIMKFSSEGINRPFRIHGFSPKFIPIGRRTTN